MVPKAGVRPSKKLRDPIFGDRDLKCDILKEGLGHAVARTSGCRLSRPGFFRNSFSKSRWPAFFKPRPAAMLHLRLEGGMFAQDRVARRMTQGHLCYAERGVQGRSPWPPGFPPGASRAPFHRVKKGGEGGGRGGSHAQKSQFFLANRRGWLCPLCC